MGWWGCTRRKVQRLTGACGQGGAVVQGGCTGGWERGHHGWLCGRNSVGCGTFQQLASELLQRQGLGLRCGCIWPHNRTRLLCDVGAVATGALERLQLLATADSPWRTRRGATRRHRRCRSHLDHICCLQTMTKINEQQRPTCHTTLHQRDLNRALLLTAGRLAPRASYDYRRWTQLLGHTVGKERLVCCPQAAHTCSRLRFAPVLVGSSP